LHPVVLSYGRAGNSEQQHNPICKRGRSISLGRANSLRSSTSTTARIRVQNDLRADQIRIVIRGGAQGKIRHITGAIARDTGHSRLPTRLGPQQALAASACGKSATILDFKRSIVPRHLGNARQRGGKHVIGSVRAPILVGPGGRTCVCSVTRKFTAHPCRGLH
jgi:hypothetical protein